MQPQGKSQLVNVVTYSRYCRRPFVLDRTLTPRAFRGSLFGLGTRPVCALQGALKPESGASSVEDDTSELRFEHYRVLQNEDGTPIELGRGAMGVTYKAVDANLRRAVALKVIDARFIGDESAWKRFVREARAAASLRHPNVASVFHLGKSGDNYFYAMEFVEGETLDSPPTQLLKAMSMINGAIDAGLTVTHQSLQQMLSADVVSATRKPSTRQGPKKISVARLPVTGSQVFGREKDIALLDAAWSDPCVRFKLGRSANDFCQVEKSKASGWQRSA
jgi:Protein kinase domain